MANTRSIAGLLGSSLVALALTESVYLHIWAGNAAAGAFT